MLSVYPIPPPPPPPPPQLLAAIVHPTGSLPDSLCDVTAAWRASDTAHCLLDSTELGQGQGQREVTWGQADLACRSLHPKATLASLPTDLQVLTYYVDLLVLLVLFVNTFTSLKTLTGNDFRSSTIESDNQI